MKIAMIGHKRVPSREGGVEIVVEELSTRLVNLGHDVVIYNRKKNSKNNNDNKIYKGIKLVDVFTINKKSLDAIIYSLFATFLALFGKYDVIHYHAEGPCAMLFIPHLFKIRTVATIHGLDWQRAKWGGFATKFLLFGEKQAAYKADEVIVLSENVKNYFKEKYNCNANFIPNGINKPNIKNANIIKNKYNLNKNDYILFLARIVPEKGLHYLLDAYKNINTDKKLLIAGGSSHTNEYFEKIKQSALEDNRIIMTGFVQGEELEELFSNAFLYVLPSDIEGMPISLLEAMSYGCPCLVSNIEENMQVIGQNGFSFKRSDVNDLKQKLIYILNQEDKLKQIGLDSREYVLKKYNWDDIVEKTISLYENRS